MSTYVCPSSIHSLDPLDPFQRHDLAEFSRLLLSEGGVHLDRSPVCHRAKDVSVYLFFFSVTLAGH